MKSAAEIKPGTEFFGAHCWRRAVGTRTTLAGKVEIIAVIWNAQPRRGLPVTFLFEPGELLQVRG